MICEQDTREEVLFAVRHWMRPDDPRLTDDAAESNPLAIEGPEDAPVFWLCGQAGTGKSTIAQTAAMWCDEGKFLGASFFCSRDSASDCSNLKLVFPTIAYQLGIRNAAFRARVAGRRHALHGVGERY